MINLLKLLALPLLSLAILILGNGFFTSFVSLRLDLAGVSNAMIGLITASFYTGLLLASFLVPSWIHRLGHLRTWILLCVLNSLFVAAYFLWIDTIFWLFMRFFSGILMGGFYIVIESWFLLLSPAAKRSLCLAIYVLVFYIATSIGQLFLQVYDPYSWTPYFATSALSALAIVPCIVCVIPVPSYTQPESSSLLQAIRQSFKGFFVGCISGALLACVYGLTPVYGHEIGQSIPRISEMMAVIVFGGLVLQLPLGKWADRWNRRKVTIISCFMAALFSSLIGIYANIPWVWQLTLFWLFGGFSFALYPLALALACEKVPDHQIVNVTGGINIVYGIGAVIGPILAPLFMMWLGVNGLFYFISITCLAAGLAGFDLIALQKRG